ncbi:MAG TPA: copper transporter [Firmicutes bacterium]|nr:copper transporter [Bacillota bacterium]
MDRGRFPAVTVAAIFLALGIGLLAGSALSVGDDLQQRQALLLAHLEAEMNKVRQAQDRLNLQLHREVAARERAEEIAQTLLEWAVADRLAGEAVAVVYASPTAAEWARPFSSTLRLAGVQILGEWRVHPGELDPGGHSGGASDPIGQAVTRVLAMIGQARAAGRNPGGNESSTALPEAQLPMPGPGAGPPAGEPEMGNEEPRSEAAGNPGREKARAEQPVLLVLVQAVDMGAGADKISNSPSIDPATMEFHRQLLLQAKRSGWQRLALGVFRDPTCSLTPASPGVEEIVRLYARQGALVVDGLETSGGQAAMILGLYVGARGVLGIFPDGTLLPAFPRVVPAATGGERVS